MYSLYAFTWCMYNMLMSSSQYVNLFMINNDADWFDFQFSMRGLVCICVRCASCTVRDQRLATFTYFEDICHGNWSFTPIFDVAPHNFTRQSVIHFHDQFNSSLSFSLLSCVIYVSQRLHTKCILKGMKSQLELYKISENEGNIVAKILMFYIFFLSYQ